MVLYTVKQVMKAVNVHFIRELDTLDRAVQLLEDKEISAMPVVNSEGEHVGVLSKSDIARGKVMMAWKNGSSPDRLFVKDFMNKNLPISVPETETVDKVARLLHNRGIHRVFVVNQAGEFTGVVSATDLIKMLAVTPQLAHQPE